MRRYISLACVALIVVMCMVSPVSAAESSDSSWMNVLEFDSINDDGSNYFNLPANNSFVVQYYIPIIIVNNFDLLVYSNAILGAVSLSMPGKTVSANVSYLGNNLYRIYGSFGAWSGDLVSIEINSLSSSSGYTEILSFRLWYTESFSFSVPLVGAGFYPNGEFDMSKNFGDNRPTKTLIVNSNYDDREFLLYLYTEDWKKYDYLEFQCYFTVSSINSISCVMGNEVVPLEVSYLYSGSSDSSFYR